MGEETEWIEYRASHSMEPGTDALYRLSVGKAPHGVSWACGAERGIKKLRTKSSTLLMQNTKGDYL